MLLREALSRPQLGLALLTGAEDLDRPVSRVYVTDLPDPRRYLSGEEIVLTGLMWRRGPADSEKFVAACAAAKVSAIGAGDAALGSVPEDLVEACRRHGLPLFEVPVEVSFRDILEQVNSSLWAERASGLAAELGRQRGLVAALAGGARAADLLGPVAAVLGVRCWVLAPTGRRIAGTGELTDAAAQRLARAFLTAGRLPADITVDGQRITVTGVPGRPEHRLASWLLACAGPGPSSAPPPDAVAELVSLVALERSRVDETTRVERRLADHLHEALATAEEPGEVRARLRSCGLAPDATYLVLAARMTDRRGATQSTTDLAPAVLAELALVLGDSAVVTGQSGEEALAVLAADPSLADPAGALRATTAALAPGLAGGRLAVGLSGYAAGASALAGAVQEARHALRAAAAGTETAALAGTGTAASAGRGTAGAAAVVGAGELSSHLLLLAGVPAETRRAFRDRLLGPVTAYDRAHHADLVRTLDTFLACAGSWNRCAELLHVHVNTLRYRIGRIEQLTGRDLGRFEDRVDFFLALRLAPGS